jgi:hypothetical protein
MSSPIGSLRESSLHASLKELYTFPKGVCETPVQGYFADVAGDGLLVEIQTGSFSKIRLKLQSLLDQYRVLLVHPIAAEKKITVFDSGMSSILYSRKSPKRGAAIDTAFQLVYIPRLLTHPNFSLEVILTREEEIRSADGSGSWRRKGVRIVDRRLISVKERLLFLKPGDYLQLLPGGLPDRFTNRELSERCGVPVQKVQKLTYCFRIMGLIEETCRQGNARVFRPVRTA